MGILDSKVVTSISLALKHKMFVEYIKIDEPNFQLSAFIKQKLDEEMKKREFNPYEVMKNEPE